MQNIGDWIYCRLVDRGAFSFPRLPFWIGQVEFSGNNKNDDASGTVIAESTKAYAVSESGDGWARLVRARILIPKVSIDDARLYGSFHLAETVQVFNSHISMGFSRLSPTEAGYVYNVRTRSYLPLLPQWKTEALMGISAMLDEMAVHPLHVLNSLYVSPVSYGELGAAFRRSSHWRNLAKRTDDEGESILLFWMAAECLCKQNRNENPVPKFMAVCGLPQGKLAKSIDRNAARDMATVNRLRLWRKRLSKLLNALRIVRNQIVHAGYRHVDIPLLLPDDQRALAKVVLPLISKCLAAMALQAMNVGLITLADMWDRYEKLFQPFDITGQSKWVVERLTQAETGKQAAAFT